MKSIIAEKLTQCLDFTAGCTEPAAIAYLGSIAGSILKSEFEKMELVIDERTYKNAYGAGIPNSKGKTGSQWALYIGFLMASPEEKLSIFSKLNDKVLEQAQIAYDKKLLNINILKKDSLHLHLKCTNKEKVVEVSIRNFHTNIEFIKINGQLQEISKDKVNCEKIGGLPNFDNWLYEPKQWEKIIDEAFLDKDLRKKVSIGMKYNMDAAIYGKKFTNADCCLDVSLVSGAIFSRMSGEPIPVMSVAGSGNKGLTCIIPVVTYGKNKGLSDEKIEKAVILAILLTSMVTTKFGAVSSVCGAQYGAGAGIIAGILYLKNKLNLFSGTYNNFISAVGGGFCDGAKGSCSMRGNTAVLTAKSAISHAENGFLVSEKDGFLGYSFLDTLNNLVKYNPIIAKFERETINILKNKS